MVNAIRLKTAMDMIGRRPIFRPMEISSAIAVLGALSQATRLQTFRLLAGFGPEGLPVGEIACRLGVPQNLMSTHLRILAHAGLLSSRRDGKSIIYRADLSVWDSLAEYIKEPLASEGSEPPAREPQLGVLGH